MKDETQFFPIIHLAQVWVLFKDFKEHFRPRTSLDEWSWQTWPDSTSLCSTLLDLTLLSSHQLSTHMQTHQKSTNRDVRSCDLDEAGKLNHLPSFRGSGMSLIHDPENLYHLYTFFHSHPVCRLFRKKHGHASFLLCNLTILMRPTFVRREKYGSCGMGTYHTHPDTSSLRFSFRVR